MVERNLDPFAQAQASAVFRKLPRSTIRVSGPDARVWLNGVITQEVPRAGQGAYGLSLSRPGKVQADVFCLEVDDGFLLATPQSAHAALLAAWQKMLVMEDAELVDATSDWQWYLSVGPEPAPVVGGGYSGELDLLGLGGSLHVVPGSVDVEALAGPWLDDQAWLELRLERGLPEFGVDFGDHERPHEASLDRLAVSWTKGCYLGQEVVCMQEMRGKVKRRLEVLRALAPLSRAPVVGQAIQDSDGKAVGAVTSFAKSRRLGEELLMARLEVAARDGELQLEGTGDRLTRFAAP